MYRKEGLIDAFWSLTGRSFLSGLHEVSISRVTFWVVKRDLFNGVITQKMKHRANLDQKTFPCLHTVKLNISDKADVDQNAPVSGSIDKNKSNQAKMVVKKYRVPNSCSFRFG